MKRSYSKSTQQESNNIISPSQNLDYELIDFGNQRKLERFGQLILNRPEVEAKSQQMLPKKVWDTAHWYFHEEKGKTGNWKRLQTGAVENWKISYQNEFILNFDLQLTNFKHIGIFPEQATNWDFIVQQLKKIEKPAKVLNLFAYTGAATMVAAKCGATVTNVDSVKQILNWARQNAEQNNIDTIRWILEDARKFVDKAVRRGEQYEGIIMDPPAFGYGTKNEKWKLEKDLGSLLESALKLLSPQQHFFILNTYSPKLNSLRLKNLIHEVKGFPPQHSPSFLGLESNKEEPLILGNIVRFSYP